MPAPHFQPVGFSDNPLFLAKTLIALPDASRPTGSAVVVDTTETTYGALDVTLTSFSGGSSPSATFALERQGADGVFYQVWTSGATSTATVWSIDLSPSGSVQTVSNPNSPASAFHCVFTATARFTYAFGGSPTSVRFSASLIGR